MKKFNVNNQNVSSQVNAIAGYIIYWGKDMDNGTNVAKFAIKINGTPYRVICERGCTADNKVSVTLTWQNKVGGTYDNYFFIKGNMSLSDMVDNGVRPLIEECVTDSIGKIMFDDALSLFLISNNKIYNMTEEDKQTFTYPLTIHSWAIGNFESDEVYDMVVTPYTNTIKLGDVVYEYNNDRSYKEFNIIIEDIIRMANNK